MLSKISLTQNNLRDILDAFEHFFPSGTIYSADKPFTSISGEYSWPNRNGFIDFVYRLTDIKIGSDRDFSSMKEAQQKLTNMVIGVEEKKEINATLPDEEARALQEEEARLLKEKRLETEENAEKSVEQKIKTLQKKYEQELQKKKVAENKTPEKTVTQPTDQQLTDELSQTNQPQIVSIPIETEREKRKEEYSKEKLIRETNLEHEQNIGEFSRFNEPRIFNKPSEKETTQGGYLKEKTEERDKKYILAETDKQIEAALANKKIVITPTGKIDEVTLTPKEKEKIYYLAQAIKADPFTAQKAIEDVIQKSLDKSSEEIKKSVSPLTVEKTSFDLVEKIKPYQKYSTPESIPDKIPTVNPASPIVALTEEDNSKLKEIIPDQHVRSAVTESAKAVASTLNANEVLNSSLTSPMFEYSKNISELFYPQTITKYQVADNQEENSNGELNVDVLDLYSKGKDIFDVWQKFSSKSVTIEELIVKTYPSGIKYLPSGNSIGITSAGGYISRALPRVVGGIVGYEVINSLQLPASVHILALPEVASTSPILTPYYNLIGGQRVLAGFAEVIEPTIASSAKTIPLMWKTVNGVEVAFAGGQTGTVAVLTAEEAAAEQAANLAGRAVVGTTAKTSLKTLAGNALVKIAPGLAAKLGIGAAAGAAVGTATGAGSGFLAGLLTGPGAIITAIIGALIGLIKAFWPKIKEFFNTYGVGIGAVLLGGGIITGSPVLLATGAPILVFAIPATGGLAAATAKLGGFFKIVLAALVINIGTPLIVTLLITPIVVAFMLLVINSGAYITPPGSHTGTIDIECNATGATLTAESGVANAAICIVSYLNQFNLNPLTGTLIGSPAWRELEAVLARPASDALKVSAIHNSWLQCVGFSSATAGLAFGSAFGQINACSYIGNAPSGYTYYSGTGGIQSGDFFLMNGSSGCSSSSPGHIGVVVSVDGALISCADANAVAPGKARAAHGCYALSQLSGYFRKQ